MLIINGVNVKSPKAMAVDIEDYDSENSERNTSGELMRDRIAIKRKISVEWAGLSQSEISQILTAVSPVFFPVAYMDPQLGKTTKTFYTGSRSAPVLRVRGTEYVWEGLKFNLVEK